MVSPTFGTTGVDWENRLDIDRLRRERVARIKAELERSALGALLTFDFHNIRYLTSTHIGTWAMDKMIRFAVLPRGGDPVLWDFGSAARHHQLYAPWLTPAHRCRPGMERPHLRRPRGHLDAARCDLARAGRAEDVAAKVSPGPGRHGLQGPAARRRHHRAAGPARAPGALASTVVDGQQLFLEARRIKTVDELGLLTQAVSMVDAAYEDLYEFLRPGVTRERVRRPGQQEALRPRVGARGGRQRDLG